MVCSSLCKNMKEENVRKIVKNGRGSYYINIPMKMMKELGFRERQKLVVKRRGNDIIIKDWKK